MRWTLIAAAMTLAVAGGPRQGVAKEAPAVSTMAELQDLYARHDFFRLRERLETWPESTAKPPEIGFLDAAVQQAFNQPDVSNSTVDTLLASSEISPELALRLRALQLTNFLRRHRYGQALDCARAILSSPVTESAPALVAETRNKLNLLKALADVPPQEVTVDGPSRLALGNTKRIPLTIEGTKLQFALDTGANFSVLMKSEAQKLGLEIRPANLVIATSTAKKVLGDVAVADRVEIGKIRYRHVVFLVLPDELLSFPGGHRIPGLVGFPLIEAMGEVRFRRDNVMEIPAAPPKRSLRNLALDDLDPLTLVKYRKDDLLCRLDTGAGHTVFYEPFFRRYRKRIESAGKVVTAQAGGVGGIQEIPARQLSRMALTVASAGVNLRRVEVYTQPIRPPEENYLFCNVGLDVLGQYRAYTINFEDMALILD